MLGKFWLTAEALEMEGNFELSQVEFLEKIRNGKPLAVPVSLLLKREERVGIARDNDVRTARKGHLYAAHHLRLSERASLMVGVDKSLCPTHLKEKGTFQLGGENRMVTYRVLGKGETPRLPEGKGRIISISLLKYSRAQTAGLLSCPYASGKLKRIAGWDMRKGFHKPAEAYFPVGAVFFTQNALLCELIAF